jgi:putative oxidoreductase
MISSLSRLVKAKIKWLNLLSSVLDLAIRVYVASVFFQSGLTKIASWSSTLGLFEDEYHVPLLPPAVAAYLGTAVELGIPVLLVLGLGTRFASVVLFVFNIVAATSYPDLSDSGLKDHILWGWLLAVLVFHGPGRISLDFLIWRKFGH